MKQSLFLQLAATILLGIGAASSSVAAEAKKAPGMVVVVPKALASALDIFVAHKRTLLPVDVAVLEDVLTRSQGVDDPEKVKRYLFERWKKDGLGYALLVGDVDLFPVRYMVLDRNTPEAFDYAFYPSDLYYSDLARADGSFDDWNGRKDGFHAGYFGEVRGEHHKEDPINFDGVDYQPDIAVGRWPVSTQEGVKIVAEKSMKYEKNALSGAEGAQRRAALFAVGGWVDSRGMLGTLANTLAAPWKVERRFYGSDPQPDHEQVRAVLNGGAGLVVHAGHGQPDSWERCFSPADVDALTNTTALPVFISAGCSTAHFATLPPYEAYMDKDGTAHRGTYRKEKFTEPPPPPAPYQGGRHNPACLGENLLARSGTGGVAYIGCNTGSQPCGLTLVEGFINSVASQKEPTLGGCWADAIRHYWKKERLADLKPTDSWYPPSIFFQGMKFMVFGDPSLRLPNNQAAAGKS